MRLQVIPANEVRSWWAYVKPGLERVLRKSPEDWLPEDIYAACLYNNASLLIALRDNVPCGFLVVIEKPSSWHVWVAWSDTTVLDDGLAALEEMARASNVKRLTFDSWRKGWERSAKKNGFSPRSWVKELI